MFLGRLIHGNWKLICTRFRLKPIRQVPSCIPNHKLTYLFTTSISSEIVAQIYSPLWEYIQSFYRYSRGWILVMTLTQCYLANVSSYILINAKSARFFINRPAAYTSMYRQFGTMIPYEGELDR